MGLSGDMKRVIRCTKGKKYVNPLSGCSPKAKEPEREALASAIDEYLDKGGIITRLKPSGRPKLRDRKICTGARMPGRGWVKVKQYESEIDIWQTPERD
uniref:Uncharacterized protein n=1 Tax=viral metagenome TaxID=1070528 RepID=A0A6M3LVW5_9ZZZZ